MTQESEEFLCNEIKCKIRIKAIYGREPNNE